MQDVQAMAWQAMQAVGMQTSGGDRVIWSCTGHTVCSRCIGWGCTVLPALDVYQAAMWSSWLAK